MRSVQSIVLYKFVVVILILKYILFTNVYERKTFFMRNHVLCNRRDTEKEERVGEYMYTRNFQCYYTLFVNCMFDSVYYTSMFMLSGNFC